MSAHPSTHHEIARLRHEERLVRAGLVNAHTTPADGVRDRPTRGGLERLVERVRAQLGARRGRGATRAPQLLS